MNGEAREATKAEKREARRREHVAKALIGQSAAASAELDAMRKALIILHPLPADSQKRALRWIADRLDNFPDPARDFDLYSDEPPF